MRNQEEIKQEIFRRRDEQLRKRRILRRGAATVVTLVLAVGVTYFAFARRDTRLYLNSDSTYDRGQSVFAPIRNFFAGLFGGAGSAPEHAATNGWVQGSPNETNAQEPQFEEPTTDRPDKTATRNRTEYSQGHKTENTQTDKTTYIEGKYLDEGYMIQAWGEESGDVYMRCDDPELLQAIRLMFAGPEGDDPTEVTDPSPTETTPVTTEHPGGTWATDTNADSSYTASTVDTNHPGTAEGGPEEPVFLYIREPGRNFTTYYRCTAKQWKKVTELYYQYIIQPQEGVS